MKGGREEVWPLPLDVKQSLDKYLRLDASRRWGEGYRLRLGAKVFNVTNHFNPRDYQCNLASGEFGGFYNGVGRRFGLKFVVEKK